MSKLRKFRENRLLSKSELARRAELSAGDPPYRDGFSGRAVRVVPATCDTKTTFRAGQSR